MSDHDFERPGGVVRPEPNEWPYHVPTPEAPPGEPQREAEPAEAVMVAPDVDARRPPRVGVWTATLVAGVLGVLLGGVVMAVVMQPQQDAASIPISLDTFPQEFMGAERNDLDLREAGFGPTVERLDDEFEEQLSAFRFAHGGNGATFGYGRLITLTIVDGILAPGIPRQGEIDLAGRVRETRRLISLRTPTVSCTFEPQPVLNVDRGIEELGEFSSVGHTECVLVDRERNLSLRLAHNRTARGSDSFEAATTFRDALEGLHAQLVA